MADKIDKTAEKAAVEKQIETVKDEIEIVREKKSEVSDNGQKGRLEKQLDSLLDRLGNLEKRLEKLEIHGVDHSKPLSEIAGIPPARPRDLFDDLGS